MKKPPMFTTEMIVGYLFLAASMYMSSINRPVSEFILAFIAIVFFFVDLIVKVKYVSNLRKEIDKQIKKKDEDK